MSVRTTTVPPAGRVIFPLDDRWGIGGEGLSVELRKQVVWLSGRLPFAQASQALEKLARLTMPPTTLWEQTQKAGAWLYESVKRQEAQVGIERTKWEHQRYDPRLYRSISMDGGMVHIRGEGWKEMKVGMVSGLEHRRHNPKHPLRLTEMDYTAVLGNVEQFGKAMWALAIKHDVPYAGRTAVTADGAAWIWRLTADLFPTSLQIVDWYHARQHLSELASQRHAEDAIAAQRWFQQQSSALYQGEIWCIIQDIQRHCPEVSVGYFHHHQRRMQYAAFRAEGYPISSGGVESGIKQFKQRLTGAGMRWSRAGAERMMVIRSAVMTDSFDDIWAAAA